MSVNSKVFDPASHGDATRPVLVDGACLNATVRGRVMGKSFFFTSQSFSRLVGFGLGFLALGNSGS